jgi:hypothetical protein
MRHPASRVAEPGLQFNSVLNELKGMCVIIRIAPDCGVGSQKIEFKSQKGDEVFLATRRVAKKSERRSEATTSG